MICKQCDQQFSVRTANQVFCSVGCRYKFWNKKSYQNNRSKRLEYSRSDKNKKRQRLLSKTEKQRKRRREYSKKRRKTDHLYKLRINIRDQLRSHGVSMNGKLLEEFLGYTMIELWDYWTVAFGIGKSEKKLYLDGYWEIDHIIPVNTYFIDFDSTEIKKCWDKRNLRLIEKKSNQCRKNKIDLSLVCQYKIVDLLPKPASSFLKNALLLKEKRVLNLWI